MLPQTAFILVENHSAKTALQKMFQLHGFSPITPMHSYQALDQVRTAPPSILVLDMQHPDLTSDLLGEFMSVWNRSRHTQVILLADTKSMDMIGEEYTDYIFSKTLDFRYLSEVVSRLKPELNNHRYN